MHVQGHRLSTRQSYDPNAKVSAPPPGLRPLLPLPAEERPSLQGQWCLLGHVWAQALSMGEAAHKGQRLWQLPGPGAAGRKGAGGRRAAAAWPAFRGGTQAIAGQPEPLTFVLTQEQGGRQPSIHDGLLVQDGGGGGRELGGRSTQ